MRIMIFLLLTLRYLQSKVTDLTTGVKILIAYLEYSQKILKQPAKAKSLQKELPLKLSVSKSHTFQFFDILWLNYRGAEKVQFLTRLKAGSEKD